MDKRQDDEWFSNPPSIRSTFTLRLGEIKDAQITTGVCGLGWRFSVSRVHPSALIGAGDPYRPPPESTKVRLEFNPPIYFLGVHTVSMTIKISTLSGWALPTDIQQKHSVNFGALHGKSPLGEYTCVGSLSEPRVCSIHVTLPYAFGSYPPTTPPPSTLSFLRDSLLGLDQTDTKFYLFSRRNKEGRKTHPLPVFASSQVLCGKSSYLDTLLTIPSFKESTLVNIDSTPLDLANFSDAAYDYDSDSDLDSDDEDTKPSTPSLDNPSRTTRRIGRVVYIPDISHKTWEALIWYLYSGKIDFLPIRSQRRDPPSIAFDAHQPACSPKSMYRLADKLGMLELRSLSLAALGSGLTQSNILQESVCRFTSLYPEVQEVESDYLMAHFTSVPFTDFEELQHTLSNGEHPHALSLLLKMIRKLGLELSSVKRPIQTDTKRGNK